MTEYFDIERVCKEVGTTRATIEAWYKFRELNPDSSLAKLLPDIYRQGPRKKRFWRRQDMRKLVEFKSKVPKGCRGVMGSVTQKYVKKTTKQEEN